MAHASRRLAVSRRLAITEGSGKRRLPPSQRRRPGHKAESAWRSRSARNPGRSQPGPQSRITRLPPSRRRRPGRKAESGLAKPIRTQPGPLATRAARNPGCKAGQLVYRRAVGDGRATKRTPAWRSRSARNPGRSQPGPQSGITRLPPSRRRRPGHQAESGLAKPIRAQAGPRATRAAKRDNSFTAEP